MIFEDVSKETKKNIFQAHPLSYNFWNDFDFEVLTENMRQKADPTFADALNRIRFGNPTYDDVKLIKTRCLFPNQQDFDIDQTIEKYQELNKSQPELMCLLPTCEKVDQFNLKIT